MVSPLAFPVHILIKKQRGAGKMTVRKRPLRLYAGLFLLGAGLLLLFFSFIN